MNLPILPKKELKSKAVTIRLSEKAYKYLRELADAHNLSQGDVIEHLVTDEFNNYKKKSKKRK